MNDLNPGVIISSQIMIILASVAGFLLSASSQLKTLTTLNFKTPPFRQQGLWSLNDNQLLRNPALQTPA